MYLQTSKSRLSVEFIRIGSPYTGYGCALQIHTGFALTQVCKLRVVNYIVYVYSSATNQTRTSSVSTVSERQRSTSTVQSTSPSSSLILPSSKYRVVFTFSAVA